MKTLFATLAVLSIASLDPALAETKKSKVQTTEKIESNSGASTTQTGATGTTVPADTETTETTETTGSSVDSRSQKFEKKQTVETETEDENESGFFLEPAILYEMGKGKMDFRPVAEPDGDLKGAGVGLRLGSHFKDIFFVALDGTYSEPEFTDEDGDFDYDLKSWTAGLTVGLQTPVVGLRVWAGYIPFGEIELDGRGSNQSNVTYKDPDMWKLGAGFRVGIVSLNLEYLTGTYDKMNIRNAGLLTGTYSEEAERDSWIASVSFPLAL